MTILIGTTTCAQYLDTPERWQSWLTHAKHIRDTEDVEYFAALETDANGTQPLRPIIDAVTQLDGTYWTYSLDDGRTEITTGNRLRHITVGQNLVVDYACSRLDITHLLFLAADTAPPFDIIPKMLELKHPLVAPFISTYGLRGPAVNQYPTEWRVENAMASAAAIFIARDVFRRIRWRWDLDKGMSDDPCYHHDARVLLGINTFVRGDCQATHWPTAIGPIETRLDNRTVAR